MELILSPDDVDNSFTGTLSAMFTEVLWFAAGLLIVRLVLRLSAKGSSPGVLSGKKAVSTPKADAQAKRCPASKAICADAAAGRCKAVLESWHCEKDSGPMTVAVLQAVVHALVDLEPESLSEEIIEHISRHPQQLARPATLHALMESILSSSKPGLAAVFAEAVMASKLCAAGGAELPGDRLGQDPKTHELRLVSLASQGKWSQVQNEMKEQGDEGRGPSAAAAVRGFLRGNRLDLALQQIKGMQQDGLKVPSKAVTALVRAACNDWHQCLDFHLPQVLEALKHIPLPPEAINLALSDCLAREDSKTAADVEQRFREQKQISYTAMEPLLKLAAKNNEQKALALFKEMQGEGYYLSEGLCGLLLSRCGESHHLRLADEVTQYLKARGMMTLAIYKTLMKVYATSNLFDRACDLYQDLKADGIEPDRVMYGCLVKFAVKCNRHDLSAELFEKVDGGDVQNYMWLIRSAGQAGDVEQALKLLQKLKSITSEGPDAAIYNCVLDACLTNGAMEKAEEVLQEMRDGRLLTLVTYNTLMKGLCSKGQLKKARGLVDEMKSLGLQPDCASYNCLISAAMSDSNFEVAWAIFEQMEAQGLAPDHYTLSILMKAARKSKKTSDADRAMSLLDRSKINVCGDEVLLNTVVDACIHRKDHKRLTKVLAAFHGSQLKPSVQSYGLLIKAYSCLKQPKRCWEMWKDMTETRSLTPNDVTMSCMLDAMVCDGRVDGAAQLLQTWRDQIRPNTVVYSTLIKGFASKGDAEGAAAIYHEVKEQGLQMNQVAFTALIDAHVRAEKMEEAEVLLKQMEEDGIQPNTITYSSLVKGYCRTSQLDRALKTFDDMLSRGLTADTVIFNTLLDGAVRASRFQLCDQLLADMPKYNVSESNFTLSIVIKMWGKRRNLDAAFKAARKSAWESSQHLDSQICTCLVSACLHNHAPKRAIEAMQEMRTWPNCDGPDSGSYSMLVGGLLRCGMLREASQAASEALQLLRRPDCQTPLGQEVLSQLFKALQNQGLHYELLHLDQLLKSSS